MKQSARKSNNRHVFFAYVDQVLAIAEERSFTRAATRCHVAQSSLSRQNRNVEVRLEEKLLEHLPRGFRLTNAGGIFQKEAQSTRTPSQCSFAGTFPQASEKTNAEDRLVDTLRSSSRAIANRDGM
ncbi:LysR family transcriptional regulator [Tunturibacter empetritectus]|uniref:LysR family transcriptional regulator n=1 Tax=Tunturiibacter empetritectus TaxID=3069691 RepID=UPI0015CAABD4